MAEEELEVPSMSQTSRGLSSYRVLMRLQNSFSACARFLACFAGSHRQDHLNYWLQIEYGEHATREAERMNPRMIR